MNTWQIDWRWTAGILLIAILLGQWSTLGTAALLAVGAFLLLRAGWLAWSRGPQRRKAKETYWRGRRIDLEPRDNRTWTIPARPPLQTVLYLVLGTGLAAIAATMLLGVASHS